MPPLLLLLLPGLDGTARLFEPLVGALRDSVRPVPIAYPSSEILGYRELEERVGRLLPGEPFALVGESFSGPVALRLAAKQPPGLTAVVLTASFVRSPLARPRLLRPLVRPALFRLRPPDFAIRRLLVGEDASPALVAAVGEALGAVRPEVVAARIREVLDVDATEALRETRVPILYVAGTRDRLVSASVGGSLRDVAPEMEIATLDGPHLILQRRPEEAVAVILPFLGRAGPPFGA